MKLFERIRNRPRIDHLEQMIPYVFALGCARAWTTLSFANPVLFEHSFSFDPHVVFDYAYVIVGVSAALVAHKIAPLQESPWGKPAALLLMIASSLCTIISTDASLGMKWIALPGAIAGGCGFSLFLLLNTEALVPLSLIRILLYSAASRCVAVPIVFFCEGFDSVRAAASLLLLPTIAVACVSFAYNATPAADRPKNFRLHFTFPWKPLAVLALFSFAYGLREQQLAAGAGIFSSPATAVSMGALFIAVYFFADRFSFSALYRSPFVLIVCGLLLIPADGLFSSVVSSWLISMSSSLMSILVSLIFFDLSKRLGIAIIALTGMGRIDKIFVVWGNDCANLIGSSGLPVATQDAISTCVVIAAIALCAAILLIGAKSDSSWGIRLADSPNLAEESRRAEMLSTRCDEISRQCRLTPREDEILRLLARGKTYAEIEKELFIASGTLKAHTHHIYTKTGVSGKKELASLFEAQGADAQ